MAQLTINTTTLMGVAAPNARVDIRLFREGLGATSVIHGAAGVVTDADQRLTTDDAGLVVVELAPTISYSVQTYYEVRVGGLTGRFTMPETDAILTDRLVSEDVEVQATTGVDAGEVRRLIAVEVADWALGGNTDPIPANKLANAPAAGLDTAAVDARIAPFAQADDLSLVPASKLPTAEGDAANAFAQQFVIPFGAFDPEHISGPAVAVTVPATGGAITGNAIYRTNFSATDTDAQVLTIRPWPNQILNGSTAAGQVNFFAMGGVLDLETTASRSVRVTRRFRIRPAGSADFGPFVNGGSHFVDLEGNRATPLALSSFNIWAISREGLLLGVGDEHETMFDIELLSSGHRLGSTSPPTAEGGSLRYGFDRGCARLWTPNERFGLGQAITSDSGQFSGTGEDSDPLTLVTPFTPAEQAKLLGIEAGAQVNPDISDLQTRAQVDARVQAGVADWAEDSNTDTIPDAKIPSGIARGSEIPDVQGFVTESQVDAATRVIVEDFAEVGNATQIPDNKIPATITRDAELPAAIDARVADWAEAGDTSQIPLNKLGNAPSGGGGGGGNTLTLLGEGAVDITTNLRWATEANTPDIDISDYDWLHISVNAGALSSSYQRIRGDDLRGKTAQRYDTVFGGPALRDRTLALAVPDTSNSADVYYFGRTADNKLLVGGNATNQDPTPLSVYGETAATGGGGGDGLASVASDETIMGDGTADSPLAVANPFTDADEAKLDTIADSADVNVRSDWNQTNAAMDDFIRNKPTIPDPADWAETGNSDPVPTNKLGNQRFTTADETKLDGIQAGAQVNVGEEFTTADHTKLDGIETGAQRNVGVEYTAAARTKLDGIQANAEVNIPADWDATGGDAAIRNKPADGELVPSGGTTGQVLAKTSGTNYDTEWADAATGGATRFVALTDTPAALGTAGQVAAVNAAGNALEFVDAASGGGGGGSATRPLGSGNFDVTAARRFATEANSADITWDDSDWFYFSVGADVGGVFVFMGSYYRVLGDDIRGLLAQTYGAEIADGNPPGYLSVRVFSDSEHTIFLGRTADNKVLVSASGTGDDALPFTLYGESAATGGGGGGASDFTDLGDTPDALGNAGQVPLVSSDGTALIFGDQTAAEAFSDLTDTPAALGTAGQALIVNATGTGIDFADEGEAGVVTLAAGVSDLPIGPVRQTTRGTVPDNRSTAADNAVEFNLPIAATGRNLDSSLVVSTDNLSLRAVEGGTYIVDLFLNGVASTSTNGPAPLSASQPIRGNGEVKVYVNAETDSRASGLIAYARYGREITDAFCNATLVLNAGDTVQFRTLVRRADAANVASMEWAGRVCIKHLTVEGSSTIIGVRSDTLRNIWTGTQAQYDAIASPDALTEYIVTG